MQGAWAIRVGGDKFMALFLWRLKSFTRAVEFGEDGNILIGVAFCIAILYHYGGRGKGARFDSSWLSYLHDK